MKKGILAFAVMACVAAVSAVAAPAPAKKAPKKFVFTKYEEAVAAATASERPILVICTAKGTPQEAYLSKDVMKNPYFTKEFVKPNLIVWHVPCARVKNQPWPDPTGLSSNAVALLNYALRSPRADTDKEYEHLYSGVVLVDSTGTKTIGAYLRTPQLQQPRADTPLNLWMQAVVYFMEAQNVPFTVSPALKKYMETDPDEKPAKKGKGRK